MAYNGGGLGKLLSGRAVTIARLQIEGVADGGNEAAFSDTTGIGGRLSAFNFATRTQIESVSFSFVQGMLQGGDDVSVLGTAVAFVNSVPTNIRFSADKVADVVRCEIRNADTDGLLAGGVGEAGRAALELTITPL